MLYIQNVNLKTPQQKAVILLAYLHCRIKSTTAIKHIPLYKKEKLCRLDRASLMIIELNPKHKIKKKE